MQIQVNTVKNIDTTPEWLASIEEQLASSLARFRDGITRLEVHLRDANGDKSGAVDKECMLEARLAGHDPVAVTHRADRFERAVSGARDKLVRLLSRQVARQRPPKGQDPFEAVLA
jgi:hypothetical protein